MGRQMKIPPLFNPSNDMALAANLRQYTPPLHIQQMEAELATLSRFWDEGPWGWSLATKQRYVRMGIEHSELPSDAWLAQCRRLSSRQFAAGYYSRLCAHFPLTELVLCQAQFVSGIGQMEHALRACLESSPSGRVIAKAPWSSSGKGNVLVDSTLPTTERLRIERIIRQQGGVLVEPFYADKALDFAMEFWVGETGAEFRGFSVFSSDEMGHYEGNIVDSQESLMKRIGLPEPLLKILIGYHCRELSTLPYRGPVGIDMMRLQDGRLHPVVEINFRMTMGMLALLLYEKGVRDDQVLAGSVVQGFSAQINAGILRIVHS